MPSAGVSRARSGVLLQFIDASSFLFPVEPRRYACSRTSAPQRRLCALLRRAKERIIDGPIPEGDTYEAPHTRGR